MQSKIFLPFVQADLGLSKRFGGTGLGLSICSQLATLLKGSINVKSRLGVGSTFTMKVPLKLVQSVPESSPGSLSRMRTEASSRSVSFENDERVHTYGPSAELECTPVGPPDTPKSQQVTNVSSPSQPRLVGLSQPYLTSSQPMDSSDSQSAAMKRVSADATRGERLRVLVAEDNAVNQEVVLRMLKLEDIYDVTVSTCSCSVYGLRLIFCTGCQRRPGSAGSGQRIDAWWRSSSVQ